MSCQSCTQGDAFVILKGEQRTIPLIFKQDGARFPLTGATITVGLRNQDNSILTKSATITSASEGEASITVSAAESALLKKGELQTFTAKVVIASVPRYWEFLKALTVAEPTNPPA